MRRALLAGILIAPALPAAASEGGATTLGVPNAVWLPLNLALFLFVLYRLIGVPMARFLETRREGIARELRESQQKLKEAEELRARVAQRLDLVERELAELRQRSELEAKAEAEKLVEQAEVEAERFLRRVEEQIERRQAEARATLVREAAVLTADLARDILVREIDDADRSRVLDRSVSSMQGLSRRS